MQTAHDIVNQMTLEEKASLCSGADFWHMKGSEKYGLPQLMVTDGPHGLRKQAGSGDHLGLGKSVPATCFPTACASAASFDRALLRSMGGAMGEECQEQDVSVILGPGVNIKRSPLCGRNFEYFSEDPLLAGELGAAHIKGVQSKGIGTSLKHFAANNQESYRMVNNSVVDMRALREIYLAAFETAVKKAQPWTVMCSYNRVNGTYASDNHWLLTEVLREQWKFKGLVMSDWGAVNDRVEGVRAGMDLQMPGPVDMADKAITKAVASGGLDAALLDRTAERIAELILKAQEARQKDYHFDRTAHHKLARKVATESAVLLKNDDGILPLAKGQKVALVGRFAKEPRYQGSGSSKINPLKVDDAVEELEALGVDVLYADGYSLKDTATQPALVDEACRVAGECDVAVVMAGLPDEYESEGFDRKNLDMPESHNELIRRVADANPNTVVVLQCGSPVLTPWANVAKGILLMYLGGEAVNGAVADLLTGKAAPSGRLPETWPLSLEDVPCHNYFPGTPESVEYRESVFVGYRYYDTANRAVAWPFGFGLGYTSFAISGLKLSATSYKPGDKLTATCTVTNTGEQEGACVVQLYIGRGGKSALPRPAHELKGFEKVKLKPGASKEVTFKLAERDFSYYNTAEETWAVEKGSYTVRVGQNSRDVAAKATLRVTGDGLEKNLPDYHAQSPAYFGLPSEGALKVPNADFAALYGTALPPSEKKKGPPFNRNSTLRDMQGTWLGKLALKTLNGGVGDKLFGDDEAMKRLMRAMMMDLPLRALSMMSNGMFTNRQMHGVLDIVNGKAVKGFGKLIPKKKH